MRYINKYANFGLLFVLAVISVSIISISTATAAPDLLWQKTFPNWNHAVITPALADLKGDGTKEVIMAMPDGHIYAYYKNGTLLPGFPFSSQTDHFNQQVNVADIDNDGKKEIIATAWNGGTGGGARIWIVRSDGTAYPGWTPLVINSDQWQDDATPTIADLNGDGKKELVFIEVYSYSTYTDVKLNAYLPNGAQITGFPKHYTLPPIGTSAGQLPPSTYGAVTITDINKDGKPEIAWGFSNRFYLFDNQGNILPGWPFTAPVYNNYNMIFQSPPAIGDIYGNGNLELFAIAGVKGCGSCSMQVYGLQSNGAVLSGYPLVLSYANGFKYPIGSRQVSPSVADINNDGKDEVMVGLGNLAIFGSGGLMSSTSTSLIATQPALSDANGNGKLEFAGVQNIYNAGSYYGYVSILNLDGSVYWQKILPSVSLTMPVIISDLDSNGKVELAASSIPIDATNNTITVYLWEVPTTSAAKYEWPMINHDFQRTGRLILSAPTLAPIPTPIATPTPTPIPTPTATPTPASTPKVAISSPSTGAILNTAIVAVSGTASDIGSVVNNVQVSVDGSAYKLATGTTSWSFSTSSLLSGSHTITAKATDNIGNTATTSIRITVDTTPPAVSIASPSGTVPRKSTVPITVSVSDNIDAITQVQFYVNGALQCSDTGYSGTSYTCNWNVPAKPGATYSLQAKAFDQAGNVGSSATITVTSI